MNNFIEKLLNAFNEARIKEKQTYDRIIKDYNRNDEEWTIINEFLEEKILELAAKPFVDYDANKNLLIFYYEEGDLYWYFQGRIDKDQFEDVEQYEEGFDLHPLDMERFCKENGLEYKCGLNKEYNWYKDNIIVENPYLDFSQFIKYHNSKPTVYYYVIKIPKQR